MTRVSEVWLPPIVSSCFVAESKGARQMFHVAVTDLQHFLATYGYWAVFFFVAIESIGIPFPGETMLERRTSFRLRWSSLRLPAAQSLVTISASGSVEKEDIAYCVAMAAILVSMSAN